MDLRGMAEMFGIVIPVSSVRVEQGIEGVTVRGGFGRWGRIVF